MASVPLPEDSAPPSQEDTEALHHHLCQACCPGMHVLGSTHGVPPAPLSDPGACAVGPLLFGEVVCVYIRGVCKCVCGQLPTLALDVHPAPSHSRILVSISSFTYSDTDWAPARRCPKCWGRDGYCSQAVGVQTFQYHILALRIKILIFLLAQYHYFSIF